MLQFPTDEQSTYGAVDLATPSTTDDDPANRWTVDQIAGVPAATTGFCSTIKPTATSTDVTTK